MVYNTVSSICLMVYTAVARTSRSDETIYNAVVRSSKPVNWVYKAVLGKIGLSKANIRWQLGPIGLI